MGFDREWLLGIARRVAAGGPWEAEVTTFLQVNRPLVRKVVHLVQQPILSMLADAEADLADIAAIANDKFVRAGIPQYQGAASPRGYYLQIVRNTTISFYRTRRIGIELPTPGGDDPEQPQGRAGGQLVGQERLELARDLQQALTRLTESSREHAEAVELFLFRQYGSAAECAALLGINVDNFHKRVERGKAKLREILLEAGYQP